MSSDSDVESEVDVAGGSTAFESPVLRWAVADENRDVTVGNADGREALEDLGVKLPFGLDRAPREQSIVTKVRSSSWLKDGGAAQQ